MKKKVERIGHKIAWSVYEKLRELLPESTGLIKFTTLPCGKTLRHYWGLDTRNRDDYGGSGRISHLQILRGCPVTGIEEITFMWSNFNDHENLYILTTEGNFILCSDRPTADEISTQNENTKCSQCNGVIDASNTQWFYGRIGFCGPVPYPAYPCGNCGLFHWGFESQERGGKPIFGKGNRPLHWINGKKVIKEWNDKFIPWE